MKTLYWLAHVEGWSYLFLLFIAMPLKYIVGIDIAVRIVGSLHGILFVALFIMVLRFFILKQLNFLSCCMMMVASLLPFATFYSEKIVARFNEKNDNLSHRNAD